MHDTEKWSNILGFFKYRLGVEGNPPAGGMRNFRRAGIFLSSSGTYGGVIFIIRALLKLETTFCNY